MADYYTRDEIAARLQKKTDDIAVRIDDLKTEVRSTGSRIVDELRSRPLLLVGGAVTIGLVVGLLLRRRKSQTAGEAYREALDRYLDVVADEAVLSQRKGETKDEAIARVMSERGPLFIYAPREGSSDGRTSYTGKILKFAAVQLLNTAVEHLAPRFTGEKRK